VVIVPADRESGSTASVAVPSLHAMDRSDSGVPAQMEASAQSRVCILIPAYNEEASLPGLIAEVREVLPTVEIVVINDGSSDGTSAAVRAAGATLLDLPCNVGVGGAVQAGFRYALESGFDVAVRIDGDGQHPPAEIPKLLAAAASDPADLVIGCRFGAGTGVISTRLRYAGIRGLAIFLSIICRSRVHDPTSGFWLVKRPLLAYFAAHYPSDYPEPEALALLRRQGYSYREVAVVFRPRRAGQSSIHGWGTFYYALKVGLALVIDRVRPINPYFSRAEVLRRL